MTIKLTPEQIEKLKEDCWLNIDLGNGSYIYNESLQKLIPTKPDDPSWHHNYPLCPTCGTYMIYNFEHCPKCGQMLLWSEFTGER